MKNQTLHAREKQLRRLMILAVIGMVLAGSCFVEAWIYFKTPFIVISSVGVILAITSIILLFRKKKQYNERIAAVHDSLRNKQNEKLMQMCDEGASESEVNDLLIETSQLLDYTRSHKLK